MEHKAVEGENRECEDDSVIDSSQLPLSPPRLLEVTSPSGNKKSPLVYFKKRVTKSGKKHRESGQSSDAEQLEPSATSPTNVADAKEKPHRKGIAKVFHDLRLRTRARKTSPMESTPIQTSLDDDSFSSYATPAEALSSGYSTPMYESTIGSPEASLSQTESFIEQDEEGDVTTVPLDQSQVSLNPFIGLPPNISRLVCGVYIVGPSIRRLDVDDPAGLPVLLDSQSASALLANDAFHAASPSSKSSSPLVEASPVSRELSSTETVESRAALDNSSVDERVDRVESPSSSSTLSPSKSEEIQRPEEPPIPTSSAESSETEIRQRKTSKSTGEIRFYFTEHCPNNNQSPQRGLMRSLTSDGKMEASHPGQDANGYPKNEHLYKVLVIGELGTGKTSIIKRYVHQFFSQHYRATIGVDFALKVVHWDQSTVIRLQLWDIAGQERFGNMTRVYYKEAVGAFIVFDVTRQSTFESVAKWKQDLDAKVQLPDGSPIPCVLLANKCDQPKEGIAASPAKLDEYCKEKGFAGWFETSAKDNINIDDAAKFLVGTILQNDQWSTSVKEEDPDRLDLTGKGAPGEQKKSTCC